MAAQSKADALRCIGGDLGATLCITAVAELKNTLLSPAHSMPQALVAACSAAVHLASIGLPTVDCVVPFVSSTGVLEQHGVAYLLEPCAPCAVLTSPVIDILDEGGEQAAIIARWVAVKLADETERLLTPLLLSPVASPAQKTLAISRDLYFFKSPLVGIVGDSEAQACFHVTSIFRALAASDAAGKFCVMPLATFMRDPRAGEHDTLGTDDPAAKIVMAFPDLRREGFKPGVPEDPIQRAEFFRQLGDALVAIHAAGIVHCDLYPHNIMWRLRRAIGGGGASLAAVDSMAAALKVEEGGLGEGAGSSSSSGTSRSGSGSVVVDVRIIDWDAALFREQPIPPGATAIVERNGHTGSYHPELFKRDLPALPELDWWHYHMMKTEAPFGGADHNAEALEEWLQTRPAGAAAPPRRMQLLQLARESAAAEPPPLAVTGDFA
jgi:hypothetical protein